jgi:peptidoglycan/xylan/chitin deacetylase (PgdA/CDA1 family)
MDAELNPVPMVLMYHSVEPYVWDPCQITVHPHRFDQQMRWLRRRRLRGTTMGELLRACAEGRQHGLVGLTFDDGYTDFVVHVMPVLARYGFTATVFVVAGVLGEHNAWDDPGPRKALMTADDVRQAAAAGMEIGSHGLTHQPLPSCDERILTEEIRLSRLILRGTLGRDVAGFCYPYGEVGEREVEAVRGAGYDYACAVRPSAPAGRHAIPRTYIGDRDTSVRLFAKWTRHRFVVRGGAR